MTELVVTPSPDHRVRFNLVYKGPALEDGSMDVRDLGNAMLAVGGLFEAANYRLNGDRAAINVKVQAMRTGSFEILLDVIQNLQYAGAMLGEGENGHDFFTNATAIKALIFGSGGTTGVVGGAISLIKLIKWLRGRTPTTREVAENKYEISITDSPGAEVYIVDGDQKNLLEDSSTRRYLHDLVRPVGVTGVDSLVAREDDVDLEEVNEEDIEAFIPRGEQEQIRDVTRKMTFQINRLTFMRNGKWQLTDGSTKYQVAIMDESFARRIQNNELRFGKEDLLHCDLRIVQWKENGRIKTSYEIYNVEHEGQSQSTLPT